MLIFCILKKFNYLILIMIEKKIKIIKKRYAEVNKNVKIVVKPWFWDVPMRPLNDAKILNNQTIL